MTLASIDRLVHHATILEMNVESYRRRAALDRKRAKKTEKAETDCRDASIKTLANSSASVNHHFARPPRLIQIDAPISPRLTRYKRAPGRRPESVEARNRGLQGAAAAIYHGRGRTRGPSGSAFSWVPAPSASAAGKTASSARALAMFSARPPLARSP